jgi:Na+-driven multidrug efflux pump
MVGGILLLGIAPFLMTAMESLVTIVLNFVLKRYGAAEFAGFETDGATLAISVGAIVTMASSFILMPIGGFAQGLQPVIGYNFGAGRHDRVKKAIVFAAAVCTGYATVLYAFFMFAPAGFVALFTTDAAVIRVSSVFLRIYVSGMLLFGLQCILQNSFAARGSAVNAIIIALIRKAVYIPLMFILPLIFGAAKGVTAAYIASPIADVLAAGFTIALFFRTYKDIMNGGEAVSAKPKWNLIPATVDYAALASSVSLTLGICGITVILLSIFTGISDLLPLQIMFICAGAFLCVMAQPAYKKIGDKDPAQAAGVIEW